MRNIALVGLLLLMGCQAKKEAPPPPVFSITTAVATLKDMPLYLEGIGHVESITSIEIRSRIEGELTGVFFTQGQEVKKGDLLFTIDPKPYEAAYKQAKGTLEQSLANLALAEEKVKRYRLLAQDEYYSQIDYETLQSNFAATLALVQQNQAQLDSAAINLDYCKIYAPIDGLTGILQVDYGNLIGADGKVLVTLNQIAPIFVTFSLPEIYLPQIQKQIRENTEPLKVLCAYETFQGELFEGSLYMLDNAVDTQTGMVKLRGTFPNTKRELWPGQFIRTRLLLKVQKDTVVIPYKAIQMTLNGPTVFVVTEQQTVEQRFVKLGQRTDDQIIVLEGVQANETVALDGQINLFSGAKVKIKGAG